jgi:hypothetical protein
VGAVDRRARIRLVNSRRRPLDAAEFGSDPAAAVHRARSSAGFRLVPRNYLYGTRTSRSLWTTEEVWYRQNVITGVFMVGIGVTWLVVLGLRTVNS